MSTKAPAKVVLTDVTSEPPLLSDDSNFVSWQSAFWALLAVMVNTLLQNSGAVLSMPYTMRIGLRSSPLLSALDPIMALVKFVALLAVGCSPRTAARHVWWDRFPIGSDREDSGTNGFWPYTVWAFLFGALPQFVKIWGMQGILPTQIVATIYFASFIFMEMLRLAAGTVGTEDLMPMPIVCITKRFVDRTAIGLTGMLECQQMFILGSIIPYMLWQRNSEGQMRTFVLTSSFPSLFLVPLFMGKTVAYVRALDSTVESAEADAMLLLGMASDLIQYCYVLTHIPQKTKTGMPRIFKYIATNMEKRWKCMQSHRQHIHPKGAGLKIASRKFSSKSWLSLQETRKNLFRTHSVLQQCLYQK